MHILACTPMHVDVVAQTSKDEAGDTRNAKAP